ncbi:MAG TPA: Nudix family hydrolase [Rudaea sp.]|nr:Nudix family hydrolase [Rudaea sp.]
MHTSPLIHVVAGVLSDADGNILLTRRPDGKHLAGMWEFPGGKCEPGERAEMALRRELEEEIGIDVGAIRRLISVPWTYPEKAITLDVYRVLDYTGAAHGREGQTLRWESIAALDHIEMPDADRPVIAALKLPSHYVISPEPTEDIQAYTRQLQALLCAGERCIQIRSKQLPIDQLRPIVMRLRDMAAPFAANILINSHVELARETGIGVHLPSDELMAIAGRPLPRNVMVAASCHNAAELTQASRINADFAVLGPVLPTASHPNAQPLGWNQFAELVARARLPVFALGGMRPEHEAIAIAAGAQGIAGISAFDASVAKSPSPSMGAGLGRG